MALTINIADTGYGLTDASTGTYRWHGHSFNPTSDTTDGYQTWDIFTNPTPVGALSIYNQTNAFDLTGFQFGIEVVLGLLVFSTDVVDSGNIYLKFKDPDGTEVMSLSWSWSGAAGSGWYSWIGMGVKTGSGNEIWKNGTYIFYYKVTYNSGAAFVENTVNFTVTNYPTITVPGTSYRGALWVEGTELGFVTYLQGVKILIPNDGTSSAVGASYAGAIWLETDGRINFIDSSGNKRRTKLGDRYGYGGWSSEIPASPGASYAGSIWGCDDNNDTYIIIISNNGVKYRIGAGSTIGDYQ